MSPRGRLGGLASCEQLKEVGVAPGDPPLSTLAWTLMYSQEPDANVCTSSK